MFTPVMLAFINDVTLLRKLIPVTDLAFRLGVLLSSLKYPAADKRKLKMMLFFKRFCHIYSFSVQQTFESLVVKNASKMGFKSIHV